MQDSFVVVSDKYVWIDCTSTKSDFSFALEFLDGGTGLLKSFCDSPIIAVRLIDVIRDRLTDLFSDQLIDCFFDFLGVWLIVWCYEWMTDWLIEWLID